MEKRSQKMIPPTSNPLNEYQLDMLNNMDIQKKILLQQFLEIDYRLSEMRAKLVELIKVVSP
jgi:hypothetical protein